MNARFEKPLQDSFKFLLGVPVFLRIPSSRIPDIQVMNKQSVDFVVVLLLYVVESLRVLKRCHL